ncbi:MAG TPA: hypothetical protein DHW82_11200 [Spirochaetia bacterium]|nr:MAG: hypothetical protein A2Y41_05650 [Spirochaetes bacterium GWB1_36_13]HCL57558.1 hypothetical protein [Spirochaetia bacterium]
MQNKNLRLTVSNSKKAPKELHELYPQIFAQVEEKYHIHYLILFCEILRVIDDNTARFSSSSYSDSDMFGGRSQYWNITTNHIRLERAIDKEINDSWQSVTVNQDSLNISGMPEGVFLDWDGTFRSELTLTVGNMSGRKIEEILAAAKKLFQTVTFEALPIHPHDKLRADLKRQYLLSDTSSKSEGYNTIDNYGELLCDESEETAKGAVDQLKPFFKEDKETKKIKSYLKTALKEADKYVKRYLIEAIGFSFNKQYSDIILLAMDDPVTWVREEASKWAKYFYQEGTVALLIKNTKSIDQNLRWAAVASLGEIIRNNKKLPGNEKKAIEEALVRMALKDDFRYSKEVALSILSDQKDNRFFKLFVDSLKHSDSYIRGTAVAGLDKLGNTEALLYLEVQLENESDTGIQTRIKKAIGKLKKQG